MLLLVSVYFVELSFIVCCQAVICFKWFILWVVIMNVIMLLTVGKYVCIFLFGWGCVYDLGLVFFSVFVLWECCFLSVLRISFFVGYVDMFDVGILLVVNVLFYLLGRFDFSLSMVLRWLFEMMR